MGDSKRLMAGPLTRVGAALTALLALAGCLSTDPVRTSTSSTPIITPPVIVQNVDENEPVRKVKGNYKIGQPYTINGQTHVPAEDPKYRAEGIASWYGPDFHGKETANGEIYD